MEFPSLIRNTQVLLFTEEVSRHRSSNVPFLTCVPLSKREEGRGGGEGV